MEKETLQEAPREMKESVEVSRMSKGYNWKIKLHIQDTDEFDDDQKVLDRISKIDDWLKDRFLMEDDN